MESQDNTNLQETPVKDGSLDLPQIPIEEKNPENEVKNSEDSTTTSQQDEHSKSENSADQQLETESKNAETTSDSSAISENIGDSKNSSSDSQKETSETNVEQIELSLPEKKTGFMDIVTNTVTNAVTNTVNTFKGDKTGMSNEQISQQLWQVYKWLYDIYNQKSSNITYENIKWCYEKIFPAYNLLKNLSKLSDNTDNYVEQIKQKDTQIAKLTQKNENSNRIIDELEAIKSQLLSEIESLKRNRGTHYDGTSERPQHHILAGEYKNLQEQSLDQLAKKLFNLIETNNPLLNSLPKEQRREKVKEKVNDIRANISAIVLIGGQAMMQGKNPGSTELPSETLDEIENFLRQKLPIVNISQSSQVREQITKLANIAQGKSLYPTADKWQEEEFKQAVNELTEKLFQQLQLNFTTLNQEIQTEIQEYIKKALIFLQSANLAEPIASLRLEEGEDFRGGYYHQAAKGYEDEGKIVKTIYPVYLVGGHEPKVPAIVITEALTSTPAKESLPYNPTSQTLALTGTSLNSSVTETKIQEINEDEKEKIRLQGILQGKRETLIKNVKTKWIDTPSYSYSHQSSDNELLLEKLANITSLEIIEQLEYELMNAYQLHLFKEKVQSLIG